MFQTLTAELLELTAEAKGEVRAVGAFRLGGELEKLAGHRSEHGSPFQGVVCP